MKNKIKWILKFLCLVTVITVSIALPENIKEASASSASVSISTDSTTVKKGSSFYVVITVSSSELMSGFTASVSYDRDVMQFVTGGSRISGNDDEFTIYDVDSGTQTNKLTYSIKFKAYKNGISVLKLLSPYEAYSAEDGSKLSISYNTLKVRVADKISESNAKSTPNAKVQNDNDESNTNAGDVNAVQPPNISGNPSSNGNQPGSGGNMNGDNPAMPENSEVPSGSDNPKQENNNISSGGALSYGDLKSESGTIKTKKKNDGIHIILKNDYTIVKVENKSIVPDGFESASFEIGDYTIEGYKDDDSDENLYLIYCKKNNNTPQFYMYDETECVIIPYESIDTWYSFKHRNDSEGLEQLSLNRIIKLQKDIIIIMVLLFLLYITIKLLIRRILKKGK